MTNFTPSQFPDPLKAHRKMQELQKALANICHKEKDTLRAAVATEALAYDDPAAFFHDLLKHGCIMDWSKKSGEIVKFC